MARRALSIRAFVKRLSATEAASCRSRTAFLIQIVLFIGDNVLRAGGDDQGASGWKSEDAAGAALTHEQAAELNICFLRDTADVITKLVAGLRGGSAFTRRSDPKRYTSTSYRKISNFSATGAKDLANGFSLPQPIYFNAASARFVLIDSDSPTVSADIYAKRG